MEREDFLNFLKAIRKKAQQAEGLYDDSMVSLGLKDPPEQPPSWWERNNPFKDVISDPPREPKDPPVRITTEEDGGEEVQIDPLPPLGVWNFLKSEYLLNRLGEAINPTEEEKDDKSRYIPTPLGLIDKEQDPKNFFISPLGSLAKPYYDIYKEATTDPVLEEERLKQKEEIAKELAKERAKTQPDNLYYFLKNKLDDSLIDYRKLRNEPKETRDKPEFGLEEKPLTFPDLGFDLRPMGDKLTEFLMKKQKGIN